MPAQLTDSAEQGLQWHSLDQMRRQLDANCAALARRDTDLATRLTSHVASGHFAIAVRGNSVIIAAIDGAAATVRPCLLSAQAAHQTLEKVYPAGEYHEPLLVAGVDQGWLWQQAYTMPTPSRALPGHRPPLYLVVRDIEDLWIALHLHDWRDMLADPRVRLFVGSGAAGELRQSLLEHPEIPEPKVALTIGPSIWPDGESLESIIAQSRTRHAERYRHLSGQYPSLYQGATRETIAAKLASGQRLRVLGITSRYTTFLQYSMRDWLAAMGRLGHETHLLIEAAPYELLNNLTFAQTCASFRPDLILMIDHFREEYAALPRQIPFVMWVQDRLPNIFSDRGGAAQGPMDFCLGFGRLHLSGRHGYPAARYMPATIGINEERFDRSPPTADQLKRHRCDVSYVSHASTPADVLLKEKLDRQTDLGRHVLRDVYDRLVAHYDAGGVAVSDVAIRLFIEESMARRRTTIPDADIRALVVFFNQQVNNALFRHQTLNWLAELGVDLKIYGRGWENHPTLAPFACGVADNIADLGAIYRASTINIQVTPHGAVHQRMLDGLAAGGFFLARWHPGDVVGPIYEELSQWCQKHSIAGNEQLYARADERISALFDRINELETSPANRREMTVFDVMQGHRDSDFMTSAASIWREYDRIAFNSRVELELKVSHFLRNKPDRDAVAASMRQAVIDRASYTGISRRLLTFMADHLSRAQAIAA